MWKVWRITTRHFQTLAFNGDGARLYGGRWNPPGVPAVYTAESRALALLELLVQDDPLRAEYVLIPAQIPLDLTVKVLSSEELPVDWRTIGVRPLLREIGFKWFEAMESAVLSVPSAVLPAERNYLLNPLHPDFKRILIGQAEMYKPDPRLLRNRTLS